MKSTETTGYIFAKLKVGSYLTPHIQTNSKWIKDLRAETLKHLEENIGVNMNDFVLAIDF
jgi:hypothetical protein